MLIKRPLGLIVVLKGETTLPWWGFIVALVLGAVVTPFSTLLFARMGNGIATNQLMKMVAGAINPGKPVANLYVGTFTTLLLSNFSHVCCLVLYVESRRGRYIYQPCWGSEDGSISEDTTSRDVSITGVGYNPRRNCELW